MKPKYSKKILACQEKSGQSGNTIPQLLVEIGVQHLGAVYTRLKVVFGSLNCLIAVGNAYMHSLHTFPPFADNLLYDAVRLITTHN